MCYLPQLWPAHLGRVSVHNLASCVTLTCAMRKRRRALEARDHAALAALMDRNFDLRRRMFGDAALGALNLRMVLAARALGGTRPASSSFSLRS